MHLEIPTISVPSGSVEEMLMGLEHRQLTEGRVTSPMNDKSVKGGGRWSEWLGWCLSKGRKKKKK